MIVYICFHLIQSYSFCIQVLRINSVAEDAIRSWGGGHFAKLKSFSIDSYRGGGSGPRLPPPMNYFGHIVMRSECGYFTVYKAKDGIMTCITIIYVI